jgi:hypothetical protein
MDIEIEGPVDDLEALIAEDEEIFAFAEPTANCTQVATACS